MSLLLAHRAIEKVDSGGGLTPDLNYWPFLGNTDDIVGGNNGVNSGASLTPDKAGSPNSAYLFGVGENDSMAATSLINAGTTHSFVFRFKRGAPASLVMNNGFTSYMFLVSSSQWRYLIPGASVNFTISPVIIVGNYYDFAIVRSGTSVSLYVDAVKQGSTLILAANNDYTFNELTKSGSFDFEGTLDSMGVFSYALTQEEITELHEQI